MQIFDLQRYIFQRNRSDGLNSAHTSSTTDSATYPLFYDHISNNISLGQTSSSPYAFNWRYQGSWRLSKTMSDSWEAWPKCKDLQADTLNLNLWHFWLIDRWGWSLEQIQCRWTWCRELSSNKWSGSGRKELPFLSSTLVGTSLSYSRNLSPLQLHLSLLISTYNFHQTFFYKNDQTILWYIIKKTVRSHCNSYISSENLQRGHSFL